MHLKNRIKSLTDIMRFRADDLSVFLLLFPLAILLASISIMSFEWRMVHDSPLMHYGAFLVDHYDFVLYKDTFTTSMPGTYLFHLFVGKLFGYGELAFRVVDIFWLSMILCTTWMIMKSFGRRVSTAAVILFGLSYYQHGATMSLQRDYIGIFPISLAVLTAVSAIKISINIRVLLAGFFFGLAACIKPHLAIGLPAVLIFIWKYGEGFGIGKKSLNQGIKLFFISIVGLSVPILGCLLLLWKQGSLPYFLDMFVNYLPLYINLNKDHIMIVGVERIKYIIEFYLKFGNNRLWFIPAAAAFIPVYTYKTLDSKNKAIFLLLVSLVFLYSVYTALSGKFWDYHWMPFKYFILLAATPILLRFPDKRYKMIVSLIPIVLFGLIIYLTVHPPNVFYRQIERRSIVLPKDGRPDEISEFLKGNLKPGDKVQPLDWTGGTLHGMLMAEAEVATPYLFDYYFYHHISNPYIQELRKKFIRELKLVRPRYIIEMVIHKAKVWGADTTREFIELRKLLKDDYVIVMEKNGYRIFEIKNE